MPLQSSYPSMEAFQQAINEARAKGETIPEVPVRIESAEQTAHRENVQTATQQILDLYHAKYPNAPEPSSNDLRILAEQQVKQAEVIQAKDTQAWQNIYQMGLNRGLSSYDAVVSANESLKGRAYVDPASLEATQTTFVPKTELPVLPPELSKVGADLGMASYLTPYASSYQQGLQVRRALTVQTASQKYSQDLLRYYSDVAKEYETLKANLPVDSPNYEANVASIDKALADINKASMETRYNINAGQQNIDLLQAGITGLKPAVPLTANELTRQAMVSPDAWGSAYITVRNPTTGELRTVINPVKSLQVGATLVGSQVNIMTKYLSDAFYNAMTKVYGKDWGNQINPTTGEKVTFTPESYYRLLDTAEYFIPAFGIIKYASNIGMSKTPFEATLKYGLLAGTELLIGGLSAKYALSKKAQVSKAVDELLQSKGMEGLGQAGEFKKLYESNLGEYYGTIASKTSEAGSFYVTKGVTGMPSESYQFTFSVAGEDIGNLASSFRGVFKGSSDVSLWVESSGLFRGGRFDFRVPVTGYSAGTGYSVTPSLNYFEGSVWSFTPTGATSTMYYGKGGSSIIKLLDLKGVQEFSYGSINKIGYLSRDVSISLPSKDYLSAFSETLNIKPLGTYDIGIQRLWVAENMPYTLTAGRGEITVAITPLTKTGLVSSVSSESSAVVPFFNIRYSDIPTITASGEVSVIKGAMPKYGFPDKSTIDIYSKSKEVTTALTQPPETLTSEVTKELAKVSTEALTMTALKSSILSEITIPQVISGTVLLGATGTLTKQLTATTIITPTVTNIITPSISEVVTQIAKPSVVLTQQVLKTSPVLTQISPEITQVLTPSAVVTHLITSPTITQLPSPSIVTQLVPPVIPVPTIITPDYPPVPVVIGITKGGGTQATIGKPQRRGRGFKYSPSLSSAYFGKYGKIPKSTITGLGERPIPEWLKPKKEAVSLFKPTIHLGKRSKTKPKIKKVKNKSLKSKPNDLFKVTKNALKPTVRL